MRNSTQVFADNFINSLRRSAQVPAQVEIMWSCPARNLPERFLRVQKTLKKLFLQSDEAGRIPLILFSFSLSLFFLCMANPLKPSTRESLTLTRYFLQAVDENDCSNVDTN